MTNRVLTLRSSSAGVRPTGRQPGELYVNWPDNQFGVVNVSNAATDLLAVRFFSTLASYAIGSFVWQAGSLYRAIATVAPGAFAPAQWSNVAVGAFLPLAGGTMTGQVTFGGTLGSIFQAADAANGQIIINDPAGNYGQYIFGNKNGVNRWLLTLGGGTAETGGNAGNDFSLISYSDAGAALYTVMTATRSNGVVNFPTGTVEINVAGGPAQLNLAAPAGQERAVVGLTGASTRWVMSLGNTAAETGANAGSDFNLIRYNDAGVTIDNPLTISRATANLTITGATAYKPGGGTWTAPSDARIKTVRRNFTAGLDSIDMLQPVEYVYKGNDTPSADGVSLGDAAPYSASPHYLAAKAEKAFIGLVAQDAEPWFSELVTLRKGYIDGVAVDDLRDVDTGPLIFALLNAVKELAARVATLEAKSL
jgi:hypothetical protein